MPPKFPERFFSSGPSAKLKRGLSKDQKAMQFKSKLSVLLGEARDLSKSLARAEQS